MVFIFIFIITFTPSLYLRSVTFFLYVFFTLERKCSSVQNWPSLQYCLRAILIGSLLKQLKSKKRFPKLFFNWPPSKNKKVLAPFNNTTQKTTMKNFFLLFFINSIIFNVSFKTTITSTYDQFCYSSSTSEYLVKVSN